MAWKEKRFENTLERQLERALKGLVRWKCRYKGLKKFLVERGVSETLFDEYNKRFGECENKAKV